MTKQEETQVKAEDVWAIVNDELLEFEDVAIQEAWLHLEGTDGESYVDVAYYDLTNLVEGYDEEPNQKRFALTSENASNIYEQIKEWIGDPPMVKKLEVHLNPKIPLHFHILNA